MYLIAMSTGSFRDEPLKVLQNVGEKNLKRLKQNGYETYEDIAVVHPIDLKKECGVSLPDGVNMINDSRSRIPLECPDCGESNQIEHVWKDIILWRNDINTDMNSEEEAEQFCDSHDFFCERCGHFNTLDEFKDESSKF